MEENRSVTFSFVKDCRKPGLLHADGEASRASGRLRVGMLVVALRGEALRPGDMAVLAPARWLGPPAGVAESAQLQDQVRVQEQPVSAVHDTGTSEAIECIHGQSLAAKARAIIGMKGALSKQVSMCKSPRQPISHLDGTRGLQQHAVTSRRTQPQGGIRGPEASPSWCGEMRRMRIVHGGHHTGAHLGQELPLGPG